MNRKKEDEKKKKQQKREKNYNRRWRQRMHMSRRGKKMDIKKIVWREYKIKEKRREKERQINTKRVKE